MPVHRRAVGELVLDPDANAFAFGRPHDRPWDLAVVRLGVDELTRCHFPSNVPAREVEFAHAIDDARRQLLQALPLGLRGEGCGHRLMYGVVIGCGRRGTLGGR